MAAYYYGQKEKDDACSLRTICEPNNYLLVPAKALIISIYCFIELDTVAI